MKKKRRIGALVRENFINEILWWIFWQIFVCEPNKLGKLLKLYIFIVKVHNGGNRKKVVHF